MNGERVDAAGQFRRKKAVDHAMALDPALSFEGLRHDIDPEMGLSAGPVPGMAFVAVGFVFHLHALGREGFREFLRNEVGGTHAVGVRQRRRAGQSLLCGEIAPCRGLSSLEGVIAVGA